MLIVLVHTDRYDRYEVSEKFWHVGELFVFHKFGIHDVLEVRADGDELAYIIQSTNNLPYVPKSIIGRWFGDHAKFIVSNLLQK